MTEQLPGMSTWNNEGPDRLDDNAKALERSLLMIFVVRVFVLQKLVDCIPLSTGATTARRRWVLLQARPPYFGVSGDIFVRLLNCVRGGHTQTMLAFIRFTIDELYFSRSDLFSPDDQKMFLVFDEAQVATKTYHHHFPSDMEGGKTRSLLYSAYRCFTQWNIFDGIIVSGTGLSKDIIDASFGSSAAKRAGQIYQTEIYADTGDFLDAVSQEDYIRGYLNLSNSVSDQRLLQRMLHWFKGRWVCYYRYLIPRLGITS
jgi:hypothetical protein